MIGDQPRKATKIPTKLMADWVETVIVNRPGRVEQVETMAALLPAVLEAEKACGQVPTNGEHL